MVVSAGLFATTLLGSSPLPAQAGVKELGTVEFARDLDAVLKRKPARPIFLQFQEIPG